MSKIDLMVNFLLLVFVASLPVVLIALTTAKRKGRRHVGNRVVFGHYLFCILAVFVSFLFWEGPWLLQPPALVLIPYFIAAWLSPLVVFAFNGFFLWVPVAGAFYSLFDITFPAAEKSS